ncbi:lytic murein transglycosylase [Ruegeria pomeroyi]|uniref:Peptidoglycan-binding protein, putative n=2 Tax=Ruegeria pomeroyi TaxID=89184 RepID=Q5LME6_RUEPO|nr:lytic murein transglycosylase [Ruegeria pomeroyi]AAV96841.1 peptidoglycan-binding protein, putative [Ruegeria pomeroyi DSS-3]NVK96385.1 lytic murein transglycosylase [Ruegeria pomeroyi]NVL01731.1 lytic murein transglycosylase [Ruegeria pomeroyi]QWV10369.1 lytic murein transglycosylase [Ruegeria pomeroyi]
MINRRFFTLGLGALSLSACGGGAPLTASTPAAAPAQSWPTVPNAGWEAWVAGFRSRASAQGINATTLDRAFRGAGFIPKVIERDRNQTEFKRSLEDYLAIAASDERIATGRQMLQQHGALLTRIEAHYGVDKEIVTAIWGLESRYGARRGDVPIVSALSTLAYDGRRGAFFEKQLIAALKILQNGDTSPQNMTGSWAGAMGHTQFIPTSYLAYAVDFTGDGRRDIWSEDPTDALASTAAYLANAGWVRGQPWGGEVGSAAANSGSPSAVLQPQEPGPKIAVFKNFSVIKRYNNSDSYAIGVGHLSDRLKGGGPFRASFGPDETGLTLEERKELQSRLTAAGYDTGGADGVIGSKSTAAISDYQRARGLAVTGTPSVELLRQLRGG